MFSVSHLFSQDYTSTIVWDNGEKREEGVIKNGKQNGVWNFWNEKTELTEARFYVKGEIYSRTKYFYKSDEMGFLQELKYYNYDNVLIKHKTYSTKDTSSFYSIYYHENSAVKSEGKVIRNKPVGEWKYYFKDGTLKEIKKFNDKQYLHTKFWKNGVKREEGTVNYGDKIGEWKKWDNSDDLVETIIYEADTILTKTKHEYYTHTKGLLYNQNTYNSNNILIENKSYNFQDNNKYILTIFYENGNEKSKGKIINEKAVGDWVHYKENGTLILSEKIDVQKKANNNSIVPTKENSILKIYRIKKNPPSKILENGKSINNISYDLFINNEQIKTISNGTYYEYEITAEGLYTIEVSLGETKTINLFVNTPRH